jgi:ADP-dependent NAD(P)H-hydrate dehydratase / NAD(P)H-hydrate epimerase
VTFFRKKPGHLFYPGRGLCGVLHVADIGIPLRVLDQMAPGLGENSPDVFHAALPNPLATVHKYSRGSVGVFTGEMASTGAARLSAMAAQRAGAGAVTLIAPDDAVGTLSGHVTSVMIRAADTIADARPLLGGGKFSAYIIGPGFGRFRSLKDFVLALLEPSHAKPTILDADVFSAFAFEGEELFGAIKASGQPVILTPHEGEFARVFPDLAKDGGLAKHEKALAAAARSGAVVVLKGADTVIAAPDGRAAINTNGVPGLATAGSGDVLAGFAGGLLSQGMPPFEAACAAVWHHADAGARLVAGFAAEELAAQISA